VDTFPLHGYDGPTVASDSAIIFSRGVSGDHYYLFPELDFTPSLRLSENMPKIDGATAFYPIFFTLGREIYDTDSKTLHEYVSLSQTKDAYSKLTRGEADLIFVLQPSDEQQNAARQAGVELKLTPVAREAFVFFVNENNPVSNLSVEQIQGVYLKKITNWKELGGKDEKILPFQRPTNSGSQTTMIKEVMDGKELPPPLRAEYSESMGEIVRRVAEYRDYPGSVGYSFRYFAQNMVRYEDSKYKVRINRGELTAGRVKFLSVDGVAPTVENIRNKSYPFTVDVFIATAGTKNPHVQELIDWVLSPEGQKLVELAGYVGIGGQATEGGVSR
jgi:phosphate transport system substrate-binding protein